MTPGGHTEAVTDATSTGFLTAFVAGLVQLGPIEPRSGDLSIELGISVWMRRSGTPVAEASTVLGELRVALVEAAGLDLATEPVPLVGHAPARDLLTLVLTVSDLLDRAVVASGLSRDELVRRALRNRDRAIRYALGA